jgi:hypothetical protein
MKRDEAINLIEQVVSMYKGTRQEHMLLQQAMEVVKNLPDHVVEKEPNAEKKE